MLGLLLLAGLGVAAAAFVDHVDSSGDDEEEPEALAADAAVGQGDLLDDPAEEPAEGPAEGTAEGPAVDPGAEPAPEPEASFPEGGSDDGADMGTTPTIDADADGGGDPDPTAADGMANGDGDAATDPSAAPPTDTALPTDTATPEATAETNADTTSDPAQAMAVAPPVHKVFGGAGHDSLEGTAGRDFLEGRAGNDTLQGRQGNDSLVTFDAGQDRAWGGMGNDSLYGYRVNAMPGGDTSFVVEDHQVDRLHGGMGADKLWLASGDIGTGGLGQDEFHLSWDVDHAQPARITDYQPSTDRIVIEFTTNHANADMDPITGAEQNVTTAALGDGSGTAIYLNGQPIAHVMGTTALRASDISVVHL